MKTIRVTRRSRKFGWAVNASPTQKVGANGESYLKVETPDKPDFVGTVKQVFANMHDDSFMKSLKGGGTYYALAFFINGYRIDTNSQEWEYSLDSLLSGEIDFIDMPVVE